MKKNDYELKCNGYKNWYTFNVVVWLMNDRELYNTCMQWRHNVEAKKEGYKKTYTNFLNMSGLYWYRSPDNTSLRNRNVCKKEVIEAIFED